MSKEEPSLLNDFEWRDELDQLRLEVVDTLREVGEKAVNGEASNLDVKDLRRLEDRIHRVKREVQEDKPFDLIEGEVDQ